MPHAGVRLVVSLAAGVFTGMIAGIFGPWEAAPAAAWGVTAGVYSIWVWLVVIPLNATDTASLATREDPGRAVADSLLLAANVASLGAVVLLLVTASSRTGAVRDMLVASSVATVVMSWVLVHTIFTLHYARLYYGGEPGGIDFNEDEPPCYRDFAYLAFTIGMTFQVSDTNIELAAIRRTALRHALLSFTFAAVILATTINLVVGLSK